MEPPNEASKGTDTHNGMQDTSSDKQTSIEEQALLPSNIEELRPSPAPPTSSVKSSLGKKSLESPSTRSESPKDKIVQLESERGELIATFAALPSVAAKLPKSVPSAICVGSDDHSMANRQVFQSDTSDHVLPGKESVVRLDDAAVLDAAKAVVARHIKLLHAYNAMRDVGQGLMGLIAEGRGVRMKEVQDEFGMDVDD